MLILLQKRFLVIASAAVVLLLALAWIANFSRGPRPASLGDLFFDESTSQFSRRSSRDVPPADAGQLVRAVLTSQAAMLSPAKLPDHQLSLESVAYFFRFTPEAKAHWQQAMKTNPTGVFTEMLLSDLDGKEVRRPTPGSPWLPANSPEGQAVINAQP